jgi:hypothetical protein
MRVSKSVRLASQKPLYIGDACVCVCVCVCLCVRESERERERESERVFNCEHSRVHLGRGWQEVLLSNPRGLW